MANQEITKVPEVQNSAELLQEKIAAMRIAQKIFATYTQEQVDKIFFEAAMAANKQRIPLAKMACEETGMPGMAFPWAVPRVRTPSRILVIS